MKTEISQNEYLQLVGLATLGKIHARNTDACVDGMLELLALPRDDDRSVDVVGDEIWSKQDADVEGLLNRLGVTVQPKEAGNG